MAIKQQFALFDSTISAFLNPLVFTNEGDAIRWFTTIVNGTEESTNINKYPEQFSLWRLADYDDKLGTYDKDMIPKQLIIGMSVKDDQEKKFTINELKDMFTEEINNVIKLKQEA